MLTRNTVLKKVEDLKPGDAIVTVAAGFAAFVDRVNDVRFVRDGKVHVDVNCYTGTHIYDEGEKVRVCKGGEQ